MWLAYCRTGDKVAVTAPLWLNITHAAAIRAALLNLHNEYTGVDTTDFNQHTDFHLRPSSN